MKKIYLALIFVFACLISYSGDTHADPQAGFAQFAPIQPHGHSGPLDGGLLNIPSFLAYASIGQTPSVGIWTKITLGAKIYDSMNEFNNTTNYRHTPHNPGKYLYNFTFCGHGSTSLSLVQAAIYKNGSLYIPGPQLNGSWGVSITNCVSQSIGVDMNGTTDYVELWGYLSGAGTMTVNNSTLFGARIAN